MNTRLQVEHPVTELVYGVDLVREQLRIARGEPMTCATGVMRPRGHAIECRITAEDPFGNFMPSAGRIEFLQVPTGPGVRWDGGIQAGSDVSLYYDSLLGKLIVWGETREHAIHRMRRALDELTIVGVTTAQPFHRRVMEEPQFVAGDYDIGYLDAVGQRLMEAPEDEALVHAVAIAAALAEDERRGARVPTAERPNRAGQQSGWLRAARLGGLRS
jgi:acetyl-CoA carboxylase biotin carboxylase subunit